MFCPNSVITKAELTKLIVKAKLGIDYSPMPVTGSAYDDVNIYTFPASWIEELETKTLPQYVQQIISVPMN